MKFKNVPDDRGLRGIRIEDASGDWFNVETRHDGKNGLLFMTAADGVLLSRAKALKLAWAIIDELNPDAL